MIDQSTTSEKLGFLSASMGAVQGDITEIKDFMDKVATREDMYEIKAEMRRHNDKDETYYNKVRDLEDNQIKVKWYARGCAAAIGGIVTFLGMKGG